MYDGAYGALARTETQQGKKNQSKKKKQQQKPTPNTKHKAVANTEGDDCLCYVNGLELTNDREMVVRLSSASDVPMPPKKDDNEKGSSDEEDSDSSGSNSDISSQDDSSDVSDSEKFD